MPVLHQLQPSFNNGEISPLLYDRVDYNKFTSSVKSGKNMFVHPQGGMSNRAGTKMLGKANGEKVRLIPFEFSNTETYMIEFGDFYCRFYTTNGQVVTGEDLPYEIPSPFKTEDLDKIRYCQSGDVMYIAWGGVPKTLTRYGHTDWKFEDYEYKNGPFELENSDKDKKISISYNKENNKFIIGSNFSIFEDSFIGRLISINKYINPFSFKSNVSSENSPYSSVPFLSTKSYEFFSSGTWEGEIKILYSYDKTNWKTERIFSSQNNYNINYSGSFDDLVWVKLEANITEGTIYFSFWSQPEKKNFVFEITDFVEKDKVLCVSKEDIIDLQDIFSSSDNAVLEKVFPIMTSNTTPSGEIIYPKHHHESAVVSYYKMMNGVEEKTVEDMIGEGLPSFDSLEERGFGYKTNGDKFVIDKIKFYGLFYHKESGEHPFSKIFSSFKVFYSVDGEQDKEIGFSIANYKTKSAGWRISSFDILLERNVVADNIYIVATLPPFEENSVNVIIGELSFYGAKYDENINIDYISNFSFGLWSNSSYYPTEVDLYQDRIVWSTNNQIDATKISDYQNFGVSEEVTDDDAVSVIIKDKKINKINSAIAGSQLVVFTDSGNFIHNNDTFTPSSATFLNQGSTGGANVKPVIVRDNIIYVHPMKQAISDYAYSFETDGYAGQDITLLANHLFDNKKIKDLAYQQEPYSIIWVLQEEGSVLACTYLRQQNVIAWTPMDFGGKVLSIGVMSNGSNQELYLAVERKNGVFIEKMPYRMLDNDPKERFFVDCGSTYRGEPANIIAGLEYLEGESVVALADGYVVKDLVVENGQITLPTPASIVTVGLSYESVLETLTFDVSQGDGSNLNRKKRVVAVSVRYNNSRGSRISVNGHREVPMLERKIENTDTDISLKSGFYREILPSAHNEPTTIKIRQDEPLPLTIVSIIPELEYER